MSIYREVLKNGKRLRGEELIKLLNTVTRASITTPMGMVLVSEAEGSLRNIMQALPWRDRANGDTIEVIETLTAFLVRIDSRWASTGHTVEWYILEKTMIDETNSNDYIDPLVAPEGGEVTKFVPQSEIADINRVEYRLRVEPTDFGVQAWIEIGYYATIDDDAFWTWAPYTAKTTHQDEQAARAAWASWDTTSSSPKSEGK